MGGLLDLEELLESNVFVRERYLSCQNHLRIILWNYFQKATSKLSRLHKDKLENKVDNQSFLEAIYQINRFFEMSGEVVKCALDFSTKLGHDCQRLFLRDSFLAFSTSNEISVFDIYSLALHPFITDDAFNIRRKRRQRGCCKRCRKLRLGRRTKRLRTSREISSISQAESGRIYEFSLPPTDANGNHLISLTGFESQTFPTFGFSDSSSNYPRTFGDNFVPEKQSKSPRKRRIEFQDDEYQQGSLIDSLSNFCLKPNPKVSRLD